MPILAPLSATRRPRGSNTPFLVWDVEATPAHEGELINTKWLGAGVFDGSTSRIEKSRDRFFELLLSDRYRGYWCYAHNGSGYDFRYLIAWLCKRGIPWQGFAAGSRLFVSVEGREFLDSMAVLPMSLREAARKLGTQHQKHEVPDDFHQRIEHYDWQTYLIGDLHATYDCIATLRAAVDQLGGTLKRTLASTAVDLWQRHYLTGRYDVPGATSPEEAAAREAYAGGRCEVLRTSIGRGEYWDINSSYPHSMIDPLPVVSRGCISTREIPPLGLVRATYDIPREAWIPPLFWREAPGERLYHPTGKWTGWRVAEDAAYVAELFGRGAVRVHEAINFEGVDLFSGYVAAMYAQRSTPGAVGAVAKWLLNSLYGRTGMRRDREQIKFGPRPDVPVTWINEAAGVWSEPSDAMQASATIMPAVAATITARSRIKLHRLLMQAPEPAYCDTDSIVTGGAMPIRASKELGACKLEHTLDCGEFVAPKAYQITTREHSPNDEGRCRSCGHPMPHPQHCTTTHAKGMPRRELATLAAYLRGERVTVPHIPGIRESLRHGKPIDGPTVAQARQHVARGNRHPAGRPYDVTEIARVAL